MERIHRRTCTKKDLNEADYYNDVVSHLEPDILESEVKWALGRMVVNKASGYNGIPVELFKTLKDVPLRCCIQYVNKSGRLSHAHRTGKGQSSSQFPKSIVVMNVLAMGQLYSSPTLGRSCLKSCLLGFSIMQTKNFQMFKLDLEKEVEPGSNCQHSLDH